MHGPTIAVGSVCPLARSQTLCRQRRNERPEVDYFVVGARSIRMRYCCCCYLHARGLNGVDAISALASEAILMCDFSGKIRN